MPIQGEDQSVLILISINKGLKVIKNLGFVELIFTFYSISLVALGKLWQETLSNFYSEL